MIDEGAVISSTLATVCSGISSPLEDRIRTRNTSLTLLRSDASAWTFTCQVLPNRLKSLV